MSTPEEKLNSPTHSGPARCTLEQLRARWGVVWANPMECGAVPGFGPLLRAYESGLRSGHIVTFRGMGVVERWRVEKIEGKRVDLVQEVETR